MGLGWVREANKNQNGINGVESFGDINKYYERLRNII